MNPDGHQPDLPPDPASPSDRQYEQELDAIVTEIGRGIVSDPTAAARTEAAILTGLHPVRPLAAASTYALIFASVFATLAILSGSALGLHGLHALSLPQGTLIFTTLLVTAGLAALACARAMRPASGSPLGSLALLVASAAFPILFALIFQSYSTLNFVPEGIPCLRAGLVVALPTALLIAWLLRRGFVLQWRTAGLAAGTLAGLTGLAMLELHCANLKAIHVMVWHVAVVVISALLGAALGWFADQRSA
jgi:hypothetical protein